MKNRLLKLPDEQSFFLFGARNTGKSTLVKNYAKDKDHWYIDLLDLRQEQRYLEDPQRLKDEVLALPTSRRLIIIDEVQKIPSLLDVVHSLIEETDKYFILTGSSARKLRHGHANLLAGRAWLRHLYPFTFVELGDDFDLIQVLQFGALPGVCSAKKAEQKIEALRVYVHAYLKEEVWAEHLVRILEPFRYFLEVAAQTSGKVVNATKIAKDVKVSAKSVVQYFSILEDTLLGFYLPAFNRSFRKRLMQRPKFYFIDTGITRALNRTASIPVAPSTYEYGILFEQFIIVECYKLINYFYPDYRLSYLGTHDGAEIDLVIERPGLPLLLIEIKSTDTVRDDHLRPLLTMLALFDEPVEAVCFARVERALQFDQVKVYPWQEGITEYLLP